MSKPMTKTEVREYLKRARDGIREAEAALKSGSADDLFAAVQEIGGCAGQIEGMFDMHDAAGVRGMT